MSDCSRAVVSWNKVCRLNPRRERHSRHEDQCGCMDRQYPEFLETNVDEARPKRISCHVTTYRTPSFAAIRKHQHLAKPRSRAFRL